METPFLEQPLELKCGLTIPNRLVKAAMAEKMAGLDGLPPKSFGIPYGQWAVGGWGLILTGNVQVDQRHLGGPGDVAYNESIEYGRQLAAWKEWANMFKTTRTPAIVQVNHPGKQSPVGAGSRRLWEKTIAPSAIPLRFGDGLVPRIMGALVFGTPKEMSVDEIQDVVRRFVAVARLSHEAGFDGVELHAAHGYLLSQFLSDTSNLRDDEYGGSPIKRAKIVVDIITAIRTALPTSFCIGIKLNSVDHQSPKALQDCLEQLEVITDAGIDFLEISGGTYENPTMMAAATPQKSERTMRREAFFLDFAKAIRSNCTGVPLLVTGGFRSRAIMQKAIQEKDCDLIGIARPSVLDPTLPNRVIFNPKTSDDDAVVSVHIIKPSWVLRKLGLGAVGAGAETSWYSAQISSMTQGEDLAP